ncbi:hypothetical protein RHODOSMS8_03612 [Rhodobiaceae bacterium]|nr:hypothetical protein RHODOSMS8_03612 [Rhodobiaceae bacterium]
MLRPFAVIFGLAICNFVIVLTASAQNGEDITGDNKAGRVLIVYDSSNSMWGELADLSRKYEAGRDAITSILNGGLAGREIGFRAYGHRRAGDCRDSELIVPFTREAGARTPINEAVHAIRPTGKTPIHYSLNEGLKDIGDGSDQDASGEIVLISDGIETCDADPCDLMRDWSASNVDIRVHVVGVGLNELERAAMSCIAEQSGGRYFDADTAEGFKEAFSEVRAVIVTAETEEVVVEPIPSAPDTEPRYAFQIRPTDADGRRYVDVGGSLYQGGERLHRAVAAKGRGRNRVEEPGDYEIEVGVLLRDGSVYNPVRVAFEVTDGPGDTMVDVLVEAPARVNAVFTENGQPHRGAHVEAYQDGVQVFSFRAGDEVHAAPGDYEFRSTPDDENSLRVAATLTANTLTTLEFTLVEMVQAHVNFQLPNGEIIHRASELWLDGEKVYVMHSGNGQTVRPATYELRSDDQNLPLVPTSITIEAIEEKTYTIPIAAGWIRVSFGGPLFDYTGRKLPTRAQIYSVDRGNAKFSRPDALIPVAPGRYRVEGFESDGFFDAPQVDVSEGQTVDVTITPQALGELVVTYAPSENYQKEPDRASASALEGQRVIGGILRPGVVRKFLPGRYLVNGYSYAGDVVPQEVVVVAGERAEVILKLRGE